MPLHRYLILLCRMESEGITILLVCGFSHGLIAECCCFLCFLVIEGQRASTPTAALSAAIRKREKLQDELRSIEKQVPPFWFHLLESFNAQWQCSECVFLCRYLIWLLLLYALLSSFMHCSTSLEYIAYSCLFNVCLGDIIVVKDGNWIFLVSCSLPNIEENLRWHRGGP